MFWQTEKKSLKETEEEEEEETTREIMQISITLLHKDIIIKLDEQHR